MAQTSLATAPELRTLHLRPIDRSFDGDRDIVLGPHCFFGSADLYRSMREADLTDPFPTAADLRQATAGVVDLCNHRMVQLAEDLNEFHGSRHSVDFWRIVTMPWLLELAQWAWTHYALIRRLLEAHAGEVLRAEVWTAPVRWPFADIEDFAAAQRQDEAFNWWLASVLLEAQNHPNVALEETRDPPIAKGAQAPRPQSPGRLRRLVRNVKLRLGYSDVIGTRFVGPLLAVFVNLLPKRRPVHRVQPETRFEPAKVFPKPFLDAFERLIESTMPESYRSRFNGCAEQAKSLRYVAGRLRLGAIDFWNDSDKIIAAYAHEAGERLVLTQHGGFYATLESHIHATELEFRNGIFLTWGWESYDDHTGRFVGLPSPLLSPLADRHRRRDERLILVGDPIRLRMARLTPQPCGAEWLQYCRDTVDFLSALDPETRASTVFRPYVPTMTDINSEYVHEAFPDMPLLESGFHEAMLRCRLLVLTSPGTTLNLAMAANVPLVGFWGDTFYRLCKDAEPTFATLRSVGIIHHSPEAAAKHIEAVWDDVDGWWNSDDVQSARRQWTRRYARTSRVWWWHWARALAGIGRAA